ncbi:MAG: hypothetical protein U5L96_13455 [Owenweeksia sp.]|nr:hypothetical protein [Owenweeksia sp.]
MNARLFQNRLAFSIAWTSPGGGGYFLTLLLLGSNLIAQQYAVTLEWSENEGVQTSHFGTPAAVNASENFYRAGYVANGQGGSDAKLQKRDEAGDLNWELSLNSTTADKYEPVDLAYRWLQCFYYRNCDLFLYGRNRYLAGPGQCQRKSHLVCH